MKGGIFGTEYKNPIPGGGVHVQENPDQILARQNPCHFLKMSEQIMRWQQLPMRYSGRLLLFPGGLSWSINQHSCLYPIGCYRNTINEGKPFQHFCDFHGKPITINQIMYVQILKNTKQIAYKNFAQKL